MSTSVVTRGPLVYCGGPQKASSAATGLQVCQVVASRQRSDGRRFASSAVAISFSLYRCISELLGAHLQELITYRN